MQHDYDEDGIVYVAKPDLTNWKNEPSVADLKTNYTDALEEHQRQVTIIDKYLDNLEGKVTFKVKKGKSKVVPKTIRKQAEWRYAALSEPFLASEDLFKVSPTTWEDKEGAIQNELILNNQMNTRIQKTKFIDEYVRTCVDEGTVVVKVGWEFESEMRMVEKPVFEMRPIQDDAIAMQMIQAGQDPVEEVQVGTEEVEEEVILKNWPTLEICDYNHVILDPTAKGDMEKSQFIIYRYEATLSDLKDDGRYTNLDCIKGATRPEEVNFETEEQPTFTFKDKPRQKVWVYEYYGMWDTDDTGIVKPFVAAWIGDVKVRMEELPFPDKKLPFVSVQYLPKRKQNYGEPDGYLLEDNQRIIGAVTRGMIDIMGRSANAQQGVRKDALDAANARRFEAGDDYKFNSNVDPRQAFHMGTYPEIPQSAMLMIGHQNNEAESLTGVKAFSNNGISGDSLGQSVGNARGALDAASKRELGILRRLADGIVQIGRKFISMNSEFLSESEVVRITNDEFVEIRRDDLSGNYDLKLSISTPEDDNAKAQELAFMLQTTGPNSDPGEVRMIRAEIARLRKMPELAKRIEEYKPEPDPLAQKMQELNIALLEAKVVNERAKGAENEQDIELKRAKTATEEAKARDTHSTADKKDLEFLEKDTGVDHEKEMDKKDFDRRAKLDEKAADALLNKGQEPQKTPEGPENDTSFLEEFNL